jgi:hypothetical protein
MSKVVGFIVGAALIVVGVLTGNPALIINGAMMIVSNALTLLLTPKGPARSAAEMSIQLGEQPRGAIIGEAAVAGSLVDAFNYGGGYGTDWEVMIIRLADHKCEGLTSFFVNDELIEYTGDGVYPHFDGDKLAIYFRSDTSTQALPSVVTSHGPGWVSGDKGKSGCDVVVAYKADPPDSKEPGWPGGRPRFLFVVKGKQCYDPRLDSTVPAGPAAIAGTTRRPGNGPTIRPSADTIGCAASMPKTTSTTRRAADRTRTKRRRSAAGKRLRACQSVRRTGRRRKALSRRRADLCEPVAFLEVEEMFAAATGGSVVTREGSVELEPGQAKSVVATFTDADLLAGSSVEWNNAILSDSSGEWVNTVIARYVEPTKKWTDFAAPVCRDAADVIADGKPREGVVTLRLVRWQKQALRVAEIARRMGRIYGAAPASSWGRGSANWRKATGSTGSRTGCSAAARTRSASKPIRSTKNGRTS